MAGTVWPIAVPGAKAKASDFNYLGDWLEGHIVPQTAGNQTTGVFDLGSATAKWRAGYFSGTVSTDTLKLDATTTGANVNEFSTDGTLAGNSDNAVPTEKAVKTYVDQFVAVSSATRTSIVVLGTISGTTLTTLSLTSDGGVYMFLAYCYFFLTTTATRLNPTMEIVKDGATVGSSEVVPGGLGIIDFYNAATTSGHEIPMSLIGHMSLTSGGHTFHLKYLDGAGSAINAPNNYSFAIMKIR